MLLPSPWAKIEPFPSVSDARLQQMIFSHGKPHMRAPYLPASATPAQQTIMRSFTKDCCGLKHFQGSSGTISQSNQIRPVPGSMLIPHAQWASKSIFTPPEVRNPSICRDGIFTAILAQTTITLGQERMRHDSHRRRVKRDDQKNSHRP